MRRSSSERRVGFALTASVRLSGAMRKAKLDGAVAEPDVGFLASRARLKGTWRLEYGGEAKRQGRVDSTDKRQ